VVTGNPIGRHAIAVLPEEPFFRTGSLDGNVRGSIKVTSGARGIGVDYTVSLSNLPVEGGPFSTYLAVLFPAGA
jgi:hypothetical protein